VNKQVDHLTIHDIAQRAKVSARTVSRVLNGNGYVSKTVRERVLQEIRQARYRPSHAARWLRTGRSQEVCAVIKVRPGDMAMEELAAAEKELRQAGYWLSTLQVDGHDAAMVSVAADLATRRPAALITVYSRNILRFQQIFGCHLREQPHVMIDLRDPRSPLDGVVIDRHSGIRDAIHYLRDRGCRRIAYLGLPSDPSRVDGYRSAVAELGQKPIMLPFRDISPADPDLPANRFESGRQAAAAVLAANPRPDAIQAFSDEVALGLIAGLHALGRRVPRDLRLVGFDNRQAAAWCTPALTTVAQPVREIGVAAARILLQRLEPEKAPARPRHVTLPTRLVVRESA